jgi:hypothetical protein
MAASPPDTSPACTGRPRVLLLTNEPPQTVGAGSIVFHRLFRDYPSVRLRVITNAPLVPAEQRLACRYDRLPLLADRINRTRLWPWRAALRALGAARLVPLGQIDRLLGDFRPEVVVTLMQDCWYYDLAARYARSRGLPLVLFVHDLPHGFEPVHSRIRSRQRRLDAAVYRQARSRLCISQGMVDYFVQEFGVSGEVLLPPRSDAPPYQSPEACRRLKQPGRLTLGYAGGLHYGYGEQLLRMLPMLRATGTVIELFGPAPAGSVAALREATDVLHFNGHAATPETAWRGLLDKCDATLQPYLHPPGPHELQYRTHFPSKLGDCLSLGLPLLITGPAEASGMRWCLEHPGCALTATDPATEALIHALEWLRDDTELRISLATDAWKASQLFAAAPLRAQLLEHLAASTLNPGQVDQS